VNDDDDEIETEEITINATWQSSHVVEVPKGWRPGSTLDGWPAGVLDQITSDTAELIDWEGR
jgi:hypothetical protein